MPRFSSRWRSLARITLLVPLALMADQRLDWSINFDAGLAAFNNGHYNDAIGILSSAFEQARASGAVDLKVAETAYVLAMAYEFSADLGHADSYYMRSESIAEAIGNKGQALLAMTLSALGMLRVEQGRLDEAEAILTRAASACQTARGRQDLCTLTTMRHLGDLYAVEGRLNEAAGVLDRTVATARQVLPLQSPLLAGLLRSSANVYMQSEALDKAEPLLQEALNYARVAGETSPEYADTILSLGRMYRLQHDTARAEPLVKKAIAIYEASHDPLRSTAWDELGILSLIDKKYTIARDLFVRALDFNRKTFGPNHITAARAEADLAQAYAGERRYSEARSNIEAALATECKLLGDTHFEVGRIHLIAAGIDTRLKRRDEADRHYRAALTIFQNGSASRRTDLAAAEKEYREFNKAYAPESGSR